MEEKKEVCFRCKHFQRYYQKGVKRFIGTSIGFCCNLYKQMPVFGNCENFSRKKYSKKSYELIRMCLNFILMELSEMRVAIEADVDEQEELRNKKISGGK